MKLGVASFPDKLYSTCFQINCKHHVRDRFFILSRVRISHNFDHYWQDQKIVLILNWMNKFTLHEKLNWILTLTKEQSSFPLVFYSPFWFGFPASKSRWIFKHFWVIWFSDSAILISILAVLHSPLLCTSATATMHGPPHRTGVLPQVKDHISKMERSNSKVCPQSSMCPKICTCKSPADMCREEFQEVSGGQCCFEVLSS